MLSHLYIITHASLNTLHTYDEDSTCTRLHACEPMLCLQCFLLRCVIFYTLLFSTCISTLLFFCFKTSQCIQRNLTYIGTCSNIIHFFLWEWSLTKINFELINFIILLFFIKNCLQSQKYLNQLRPIFYCIGKPNSTKKNPNI